MEQRDILSAGANFGLTREAIAQALRAETGCRQRSDAETARRLAGPAETIAPRPNTLVPAAVLVPLVLRELGTTILLTQRTAHLANHAGQISFPGGRIEPGDTDAAAAALRETAEEIGLGPEGIDIIGQLDDYLTSTGFLVTPIVGFVRPPLELSIDEFEVAEIFELPLAFLLDPGNHQHHSRQTSTGEQRFYYAMTYADHYIWGATAGMLINLYEVLMRCCAS